MVSSFTPNSGSGASQSFTAVLSDLNGFADITGATLIINSALDGNNGCYISFSRIANMFYLFRDSDASWQAITPGASTSVTNTNCTLSGSGLSVTGAGNNLSVVLPLSFKPAFSGIQSIYISVFDAGNLSSGWVAAGTWTPFSVASPSAVSSLTPNSGSGAAQSFTAVLSDANGLTDIASALIVINNSLSGSNSCYISFNRVENTFYLFRDSDASWQAITPGASHSVTNTNCTLSGSGLSATGTGNNISVVLPLSFKSAFSGIRNFYITVFDVGNLSSGWITAGTWNGT